MMLVSTSRWVSVLCWPSGIRAAGYWTDVASNMARHAEVDAAQRQAVYRAALTLYYQAAEVCDDSYGGSPPGAEQPG